MIWSTNLSLWTPYFLVDILNWQIQTDDLAVDKQLAQRKEQTIIAPLEYTAK